MTEQKETQPKPKIHAFLLLETSYDVTRKTLDRALSQRLNDNITEQHSEVGMSLITTGPFTNVLLVQATL